LPLFTQLPRRPISETELPASGILGKPINVPITIRRGRESTKEKVSVGRKRDDEGLQDWEKDRDQDRQEEHDERASR
jgi:hypothetical protein